MNLSKRIDEALSTLEERPPGNWRDGASAVSSAYPADPDGPASPADPAGTDAGDYQAFLSDPEALVRLANTRMPFGKYAGRLLLELPEAYVLWFASNGYPKGELGSSLAAMAEIKANGMEALLRPLVDE